MISRAKGINVGRIAFLNLATSACFVSALSYAYSIWLFDLPRYASGIFAVCFLAAFLYPMCLRVTRSDVGYFVGMSIFALTLTVALGYSEIVYYSKMEANHHDFSESIVVLTILWVILESVAVVSYTLGFFGSRRLFKRQGVTNDAW
jgi:hypothetical protein